MGRLQPDYFPHIFGKEQNEPLSYETSLNLFKKLTEEINQFQKFSMLKEMSIEEVALGFIKVANEAMCRPIRNLTEGKGYDTRKHALACFGGAGGQHCCSIARSLGIRKIIVNKYSGILSAYGLSLADVVHEEQEPCNMILSKENMDSYILGRIDRLKSICIDYLTTKENFHYENIVVEIYLNLRFEGTDTSIMTSSEELKSEYFEKIFLKNYNKEYGFTLKRRILVDNIWVRGIGKTYIKSEQQNLISRTMHTCKPIDSRQVYFDGKFLTTSIYNIEDFFLDNIISGPAIIIDKNSTLLIEPDCVAYLNKLGDVVIELETKKNSLNVDSDLDIIQLSVFSHRFMSIAEQMGRILQRFFFLIF